MLWHFEIMPALEYLIVHFHMSPSLHAIYTLAIQWHMELELAVRPKGQHTKMHWVINAEWGAINFCFPLLSLSIFPVYYFEYNLQHIVIMSWLFITSGGTRRNSPPTPLCHSSEPQGIHWRLIYLNLQSTHLYSIKLNTNLWFVV